MSLLIWVLCLTTLTGAYLLMPNAGLLCALLLFVLAPVVSWIILVAIHKKIQIRLTTPGVVGKRKPFTLSAQLHSDTRIPLGRTVMWLQLTNTATGEVQKKRVSFRGSGQWILESIYCGCIECRAMGVWCYDIFGILPLHIPCKAKKRIVVMPDTFPVEIESTLSQSDLDDCSEYAPDQKGTDRTETFQIRDYVPGDSLQQIHWKLSSKLDKLIVRDPALPIDHELMVFLDRSQDVIEPAEADALMEAVTSVCQGLAEAGQPFQLAWNEDVIAVYEVGNKEQLPEAVAAMLKSRRVVTGRTGSDLYQKTRGDVKVGAVLYFCSQLPQNPFPKAKVQIYMCGHDDNVTSFTPLNVSDVLRKISWS